MLGFIKCFYGRFNGEIFPYYDIYNYSGCNKKVIIGILNKITSIVSTLDVPIEDCVFDFPEKEFLEKRYEETGIIWGRKGK